MAGSASHRERGWGEMALAVAFAPVVLVASIFIAISQYVAKFYDSHPVNMSPLGYLHYPGIFTFGRDFLHHLRHRHDVKKSESANPSHQPRRVLITGSGPLALEFAREFWKRGDKVIVSDVEPIPYLSRMRFSRAVEAFVPYHHRTILQRLRIRRTPEGYFHLADHVLSLVQKRDIDLWLPLNTNTISSDEKFTWACHIVAFETPCTVLYPPKDIAELATDSSKFEKFVQKISGGVKRPKVTRVRSRGEIHGLIGDSTYGEDQHHKFLLTPLSKETHHVRKRDSGFYEPDFHYVNGANGYDSSLSSSTSTNGEQTPHLLPLESMDKTYDLLAKVDISPSTPWLAADIVTGKLLQVNSLMIDGQLRTVAAFLSSKQTSYPGDYHINHHDNHGQQLSGLELFEPIQIDHSSALYKTLESFTKSFVATLPSSFSSSLNITFLLQESSVSFGFEERLWVLGCDFEPSDDLFLFDKAISSFVDSINGYIGGIKIKKKHHHHPIVEHKPAQAPYSFPSALWQHILLPIILFAAAEEPTQYLLEHMHAFSSKLLYGKEYLFDLQDPLPWVWYWSVENPLLAIKQIVSHVV